MQTKLATSLFLLVTLIVTGSALAVSQREERHTRHLYTGKVSRIGTPVKAWVEFDYGDPSLGRLNNSTWIDLLNITTLSASLPASCNGQGPWGWNGGERVRNHSFAYKEAEAWANKDGYVDLAIIHGKVSGWDKKRLSWRKLSGTIRVAEAQPAYTDDSGVDHPAFHCDKTYKWSALRRG